MSERTGDKADTSPQPAGSATRPTAKKGAAKKAARKTATRKRTGAKAKPDATTPARAVQTPDERKADTAPSRGDKTPVPLSTRLLHGQSFCCARR
ncbi:hypothetical protein [Marilutibacter alkalisoli]|uniref:Uncharacterized protein n=1 Tax=Marilutibacter alkalisoli TaxID=2591633 RepID=A0A514BT80_9GAMM|nr:hypothetical protein [Lysobacter alkalisoli]QDH70590.1 hypothetical protein FKV23_11255 [Lysobacter alkalisoli]